MIRTRITELLGIERPIVQGGMQNVGVAELASAVSNAGGLGILTALTQPSPEALSAEIERCRSMTDRPFGVNLTVFPTINSPDYRAYAQAIVDSGVKIVETAETSAVAEIWEIFKASGLKIIHKCTSVRHALSAERKGVDAISIDGFECAGHPGEDDVGGLVLIPAAASKVKIPLIASGGIADGRGLVAALALGAHGVNMGTRFCATVEAPIHERVKQAIVAAGDNATLSWGRRIGVARTLRNAFTTRFRELELGGASAEELKAFIDAYDAVPGGRRVGGLRAGDLEQGEVYMGAGAGMISEILTCAEVIERTMSEARRIHRQIGAMLAIED